MLLNCKQAFFITLASKYPFCEKLGFQSQLSSPSFEFKLETMRKLTFVLVFMIGLITSIKSQSGIKSTMAVLNFESVGLPNTPNQLGAMVRLEVMKLYKYVVIEKHDMLEALDKNAINIENCYSTSCMRKAGVGMSANYVLSGTFEVFGSKLVINYKWYDIAKSRLIKSVAYEYIYVAQDLEKVAKVSVQKLLDLELDNQVENLYNYEVYAKRELMNSDLKRVNLSGPRFGFAYLTGQGSQFMLDPKSRGGLGVDIPVMTQIGYQWEKAYLNAGNSQALFEFITMFTGMDKGIINPSFVFLNGFRLNKTGWEIGFGPSFSFTKESLGYYGEGGLWIGNQDSRYDYLYAYDNPDAVVKRLDRRGKLHANASWLVSAGKTFKSGTLNVPVNVYANFTQQGTYYGLSLGYNISK